MSQLLSNRDLGEMRARDSQVTVFRDVHGGEWVARKDGRVYGQHAVMDRRRLLRHLDGLIRMTSTQHGEVIQGKAYECGWVVEAPQPTGIGGPNIPPKYLYVPRDEVSGVQWTMEPRKAMRFAREDDVRAFMNMSALSIVLIRPKFFEWETQCSS